MPKIDALLLRLTQTHAADLHLAADQKPRYRIKGEVMVADDLPALGAAELEAALLEILSEPQQQRYREKHTVDFACAIDPTTRVRGHYYRNQSGPAATFRPIPAKIPTLAELQLPEGLKKFAALPSGLVLVVGPAGSGKTTTIAALVDHINATSRRHILILEDPLEFVHTNNKALLTQRQVGTHTTSVAAGLRSALRQDVDVIVTGDLADGPTLRLALAAAARGLLVLGTLEAHGVVGTVKRLLSLLPGEEETARALLADGLQGIIVQHLLGKKDGSGRLAVHEIMTGTATVTGTIREGNMEALQNVIQAGRKDGMNVLDEVLEKLATAGIIDGREAWMKSLDKRRFAPFCKELV